MGNEKLKRNIDNNIEIAYRNIHYYMKQKSYLEAHIWEEELIMLLDERAKL